MIRSDAPLEKLITEARSQLRMGNAGPAKTYYEAIIERDPANSEALNFLAVAFLEQGRLFQGCAFLLRAVAISPGDALLHANLGRAYELVSEPQNALRAFQNALILQPELFEVRLRLGATQELLGLRYDALESYFGAIVQAQRNGSWIDKASTPVHLRRHVANAMGFIGRFKEDTCALILGPLTEKYGGSELHRVRRCISGLLQLTEESPKNSQQLCKVLYFPGLPEAPFFSRSLFPFFHNLEAATAAIRGELMEVLHEKVLSPFLQLSDKGRMSDYVGGEGTEVAWNAYFFFRHGQPTLENLKQCPVTAQALRQCPLTQVADNAPEVCFSILTPGAHILPHHGSTNTRAVIHLPLVVPQNCGLRVGGELHHWEEGRCVAFDDTFEHEAWNKGEAIRAVMILDVWNPYMTDVECEAIAQIVPALGRYERAARPSTVG